MKPFLVVNPHSAGGWTGRHFDRILRAVRASVGEVEWACSVLARMADGVPATLTVTRPAGAPVILENPARTRVLAGQPGSFSVAAWMAVKRSEFAPAPTS